MATIVPRKRKDGSTGYLAQIIIKRQGKVVHQESQTFDRRQAASAWSEARRPSYTSPVRSDARLTILPQPRKRQVCKFGQVVCSISQAVLSRLHCEREQANGADAEAFYIVLYSLPFYVRTSPQDQLTCSKQLVGIGD